MANGLAQQSAGTPKVTLDQVVGLLMQGVNPEQLLQQGVPIELIQEAIQFIMAQEQQEQTVSQPANTNAGLAATQAL